MIGIALLEYERSQAGFGSVLSLSHKSTPFPIPVDIGLFFKKARTSFEQGVSFVAVEFLEAYLEDILDLQVDEEDLYIAAPRRFSWPLLVSVLGLCFSLAAGLYAVSFGVSLAVSFAFTVVLAFPFGILWHFSPRDGLSRRLLFAKLLQNEISRRRGDTGPYAATPLRAAVSGRLFGRATISSARSSM